MSSAIVRGAVAAVLLTVVAPAPAPAQSFTYRGFAELRGFAFPQDAPNDPDNLVGDALVRAEAFATPIPWLQAAAGLDLRGNTHDQVTDSWRLEVTDRSLQRPALALRRLSATVRRGALTVDVGKQFIRWGKTDIVTPTDRFAPRDFLNIIDTEFLGVRGARVVYSHSDDTIDVVWLPWFTPSRMPLLTERWTVIPAGIRLIDTTGDVPDRSQVGVRWSRVNAGHEFSLSYFDGLNHLPDIAFEPATLSIVRRYPRLRTYGGDFAMPVPWFTVKAESAFFEAVEAESDDYVLYVVQLERIVGEWTFVGGYAGEAVARRRTPLAFAPDRGTSRSIVGRAAYTIGPTRSASVEAAVRQNGDGAYVKGDVSQARGQHWRFTVAATLLWGEPDDFLGQFERNSHVFTGIRYSF